MSTVCAMHTPYSKSQTSSNGGCWPSLRGSFWACSSFLRLCWGFDYPKLERTTKKSGSNNNDPGKKSATLTRCRLYFLLVTYFHFTYNCTLIFINMLWHINTQKRLRTEPFSGIFERAREVEMVPSSTSERVKNILYQVIYSLSSQCACSSGG